MTGSLGFEISEVLLVKKIYLSYDVAVVQKITLCHKNHMSTPVTTLWHVHVTSLTRPCL